MKPIFFGLLAAAYVHAVGWTYHFLAAKAFVRGDSVGGTFLTLMVAGSVACAIATGVAAAAQGDGVTSTPTGRDAE